MRFTEVVLRFVYFKCDNKCKALLRMLRYMYLPQGTKVRFPCLAFFQPTHTCRQIFENRPIVHVEWESRAIFLTIYDDLYKTYLWGICITLNLFVALTSA